VRYWPDSSLTSFDKKWFARGIPIWVAPQLAKVGSAGGDPTNATVKSSSDTSRHRSHSRNPNALIDLEIKSHTIPHVRDEVQRKKELGTVTAYKATSRGCYFDFKARARLPHLQNLHGRRRLRRRGHHDL